MNSRSIQESHRSVYEKFFTENQVIVSAPFVMNRSWDVLNNYTGVSIKQKIPLRIYMWYTRNPSSQIKLKKITHLDINEDSFIQSNILEYAPYFTDLQKEIQRKYAHLVQDSWGIEINILSELPRGVGLGFWSILTLLLSTLFQRIQETVLPSQIQSFAGQNINDLLSDQYSSFYQLFLESLDLDKHMYGMISSGTKLAAFFDTYYPVVSFCEDFDKNTIHANVSNKRFFGFKMNDLFPGCKAVPYSPIDYGLIYSGKPVLLEQIAGNQYKSNTLSAKEIKTECKNLFGDYLQEIPLQQRPRFYKHLIAPETDEFELIYGKIMGIISLKIMYFMSKMYADGYDEDNVMWLLDALRKRRQTDCVTRDSSSTFLNMIKHFLENFHAAPKNFSICPNDSTIMGWSLIFAAPLEWFRDTLSESIHQTATQCSGTKLLYTNRIDGTEHHGLKIEQDLKYNIFSDFLEPTNCIVRRVNGKVLIADCEASIENHKSWLLLDTLHNRIYLNGEKLTSQDLHSQSATIEVIKILIQNLWQEVDCKQFPPSTYSKNKNEMVSKIVLPLMDLVEKKTGKRLQLICKWSLYDFYMKLNVSDVDIAVISRFVDEDYS